MKRLGGIFDLVIDRENLAAAFNRVCCGKRRRADIREYAANLEENLNALHRRLAAGMFRFGNYNFFKIYDPKERTIAAAPVEERIVHHALIAVIGGRLERALIDKSYACRKGKGQWAAVAEAKRLAARHEWCLKLDIRHFFDSIDHEILLRLLERKIKDRRVLALLQQLVESYETEPGKGVPIGNLTSQYFANLYLDRLDRFLTQSRSAAEVRYMDDMLVFGGHGELRALMKAVPEFLRETLKLELKAKGGLHRTARGVEFLGTRVFPRRVALARRSKTRFRRKVALLDGMLAEGRMSERRYQTRMTQLFAFVRNCDTEAFRRKVISESGQGELPRRARRLLERQQQRGLCRRVPLGLSQLQHQQQHEPEQCEQLLGLACLLLPRSSRAEYENRLNRPFPGSSCGAMESSRPTMPTNKSCPRGAGRRTAVSSKPPYRAERHAGLLYKSDGAEIGNANQAACAHHAEDVAGGVRKLVYNAVGPDHQLAKPDKIREVFFKGAFGNAWAGKREVCQIVNGIVDFEKPFCGRADVAFGGDDVVDFIKLAERGGRPDDVHIPCLSRNCRMAVLWSMPRPSAISLRDLRTVSARRNTSISGSKSAALMRTASARPLRVTMSGRCVSLTRAKHAARLLRYSENGMMSSVRRGRRGEAVRVCMGDLLLRLTMCIVQKNVQLVKGQRQGFDGLIV